MEQILRFSIQSDALIDLVDQVVPCAATRPVSPILGALLIEVLDSRLNLRAQNGAVDVTLSTAVESTEDGIVAVDAYLFRSLVKGLPPGVFSVILNRRLVIRSGSSHRTFSTYNPEEFPVEPNLDSEKIEYPAEKFRELIDRVAFACASDYSRPVLTGAHFDWGRGLVVGSDGILMVGQNMDSLPLPSTTVPASSLSLVNRLLQGVVGDIELRVSRPTTTAQTADRTIHFQHLADPYPTAALSILETFVGRNFEVSFICPKQEIVRIASTAAILSDAAAKVGGDRALHLKIGEGSITCSISAPDVGEMEDSIAVEGHGSLQYSISPEYLHRLTTSAPGDSLRLSFIDPVHPCLIQCLGVEGWNAVLVPLLRREEIEEFRRQKDEWSSSEDEEQDF